MLRLKNMTLIAYAEKTLYADNRAILNSETSSDIKHVIKKLHVSKCKRVAIASAGMVYDEFEFNYLFGYLISYFEKDTFGINDIPKDSDLNKYIFKESGGSLVVMTNRNIYELNSNGGIRLNKEHPCSFGSGGNLFDFGYTIIKGPKTLAKITKLFSDISIISPYSGPLADRIKMSDLKPFKTQ